ncbi:uncharacterized protein B0I36DRAFT_334334 [Microdochium trichocladiopsis]|uniref:Uncharacterized protein n=1 Tax=Microdochium trichocladiopsis TaxID=1682393 RepID=A0A9P9BKM2_9PEZI|nr:uncharacterized protein B0I36DRAFT_334334 [Microdochium trichocladiopsis]KAH7021356.1 hypothetical protein B0I36DRAFT_334334 [Microdochium trichocladiopsis]
MRPGTLARLPGPPELTVDPDCAICHLPPNANCGCEANAMVAAVKEAESRVMKPEYRKVREWARHRAQDYVLQYFGLLSERRKQDYRARVAELTDNARRYYGALPHPSDMRAAHEQLRRGINEDWKASVTRYPEVLDYFFSLVKVRYPSDSDPRVRDPPLSAMNGIVRRSGR